MEAGGGVEEGRSRGLVAVQTSLERQPSAHLPAASPSCSRPLRLRVSFPRPPCCAHGAANPSLFRPRCPRAQLNPRTVPSLSLPPTKPTSLPLRSEWRRLNQGSNAGGSYKTPGLGDPSSHPGDPEMPGPSFLKVLEIFERRGRGGSRSLSLEFCVVENFIPTLPMSSFSPSRVQFILLLFFLEVGER